MKTSLFDFHLPESLIATEPAHPRDAARMLIVNESLHDSVIRDLPSFLREGDVVVFNDTKVIPARLIGKRGTTQIEVLLHKAFVSPSNDGVRTPRQARGDNWTCFAKPAKKLRIGDEIVFDRHSAKCKISAQDPFFATVLEKLDDGQVLLLFPANFYEKLLQYGHIPLPPYIEKKRNVIARNVSDEAIHGSPRYARDDESYQTTYAKHEGSVAAPTAGLHFTPELLAAIDATGAKRVHITLHVGGGTFLPVKAEDTSEHVMHSEWAHVSAEAASAINAAKRVIAVGTTSLRTLESATDDNGVTHHYEGETNIFITPGYRFKCVDVLLTNFHLPKSTLFMLVSAFSGLDTMKNAYAHAIRENYRFYSYGDACLLFNDVNRASDDPRNP